MPNVRTTSYKKYNISSHRFLELYHFCLQYQEWLKELENIKNAADNKDIAEKQSAHDVFGPGSKSDKRRAVLEAKCRVVEQTAIEADSDIYQYILKAVTQEKISFKYLKNVMNMPCEKDMYYDRRRKFYWLLSQKI